MNPIGKSWADILNRSKADSTEAKLIRVEAKVDKLLADLIAIKEKVDGWSNRVSDVPSSGCSKQCAGKYKSKRN